jgi:hypothetical protein
MCESRWGVLMVLDGNIEKRGINGFLSKKN